MSDTLVKVLLYANSFTSNYEDNNRTSLHGQGVIKGALETDMVGA